jgi:hypothetical protein
VGGREENPPEGILPYCSIISRNNVFNQKNGKLWGELGKGGGVEWRGEILPREFYHILKFKDCNVEIY